MNPTTSMIGSVAAAFVALGAMVVNLAHGDALPPTAVPDPRLDGMLREHAAIADQVVQMRRDHDAIARQLEALAAVRQPAPATTTEARPEPPPEDAMPPTATPTTPAAEDRQRLLTNLARMFRSGTRGPDMPDAEQEQFYRRLRTTGIVDELVTELEAAVERAPNDAAVRMQLADAYTAKLSTIPGGPEQGVWGGKAERQWQAVLERQPEHWEARFALGFNYSMYPSFVDRSAEAIEHLEVARRLLPSLPPEPRQADVFTALARMYQRQGKPDAARTALAEGLQRFPGDEGLLRAQQQVGAPEDR